MIGIGTKLSWSDFASLYEGSVDTGRPMTLDLGRTRLHPGRDFIELFRVGGPGQIKNPTGIPTLHHGSVHCRTYTVCGTNHGTLHYTVTVRVSQRQGLG
jgi:hypothetical protein